MIPAALLTALVVFQVSAAPQVATGTVDSGTPTIAATVRPERVRVGGRVVLTVRVDYEGHPPDEIQLVHAPEVDVVDVRDRRRVGQWERDFVLIPTGDGAVEAAPSEGFPTGWLVEVEVGTLVYAVDVVPPTVESAGDWVGRDSGDAVAARGDRPEIEDPSGRLAERRGPAPLARGFGSAPLGRPARHPIPGGWAERAHLDPWWPEIVPEFHGYDASVGDGRLGMVIEAAVTPATVYVGQQLSLFTTFSYPPERVVARPWYRAAEPTDFSRVELGAVSLPAVRGGDLEHSLTFQTAYFPTTPGEWSLPTGQLMLAGPRFVTGPPIAVQVLPVPVHGAPPGYNGAVGRFEVIASVEPEAVVWGQQARLRVEVRGVGDVRSLPEPVLPRVGGGVIVPFRDLAWPEVRDGVVGGLRVFEYVLSPADLGTVEVAPIVFSFFDPYVGDFGMAATEELRLEVVR